MSRRSVKVEYLSPEWIEALVKADFSHLPTLQWPDGLEGMIARDSGSDRQAKTPQAAEGEASQSGLSDSEGIAQ